jgi:hypothetical protein
LVNECADLIAGFDPDTYNPEDSNTWPDPKAEADAFLEFYGADWYKDQWWPKRLILKVVTIWATGIKELPNKIITGESPEAVCLTTDTYRTFDTSSTFICNEESGPFAIDDNYIMKKDVYSDNVLENDIDWEEDYPLSAILVEDPSHGDVTLNTDGSFTYEKGETFIDQDCFKYKAVDALSNEGNEANACLSSFK